MGGLFIMALAAAASPPTVLWMPQPDDSVVVQRIRGQLSDLSWRLEIAPRSARIEAMPSSASAAATASVNRHGDFTLRLRTAEGRQYRRDVAGLGQAANREAAALILRSALRAIDEGLAPDWTEEPSKKAPSVETSVAVQGFADERSGWGWYAGGRGEINGYAQPAAGLSLEIFRRWNRWTATLVGQGRWPMTVDSDRVALTIQRYDAAVVAGFDAYRQSTWSIGLRAGVGPTLWNRSSAGRAPDLAVSPDRWLIGARFTTGVRWAFHLADGWGVAVEGGIDALVGAPRWTLGDGTLLDQASPIQPCIGVLVGMDPTFALGR
ncbi:MAG: hypothetical protein AAF449_14400 [Myxococcota bacterium]